MTSQLTSVSKGTKSFCELFQLGDTFYLYLICPDLLWRETCFRLNDEEVGAIRKAPGALDDLALRACKNPEIYEGRALTSVEWNALKGADPQPAPG